MSSWFMFLHCSFQGIVHLFLTNKYLASRLTPMVYFTFEECKTIAQ